MPTQNMVVAKIIDQGPKSKGGFQDSNPKSIVQGSRLGVGVTVPGRLS